ncbi:hypothetical protein FRB97_009524 [Tulasnella sp. 331]|nr:hypothetical protein FRB97_009524 [Tulasnella sp. 331]
MPNPNKPPNDTITSGEEANPPNEPRNLSNVLPAGVEELRQGRILTSQSSAVVAALFASIEATIITANDTSIGRPVLTNVELVLAYFVLFTSASTTFTSLFLIDRLGGSLPFDRITKPEAEITPSALKTGRKILARYGAGGPQWDTLEFHCEWFAVRSPGYSVDP